MTYFWPCRSIRHSPSLGRTAAAVLIAAITLIASGCARDEGLAVERPQVAPTVRDLDASLLIGTDGARDIGYRVDWQYPVAGPSLKVLTVQGDSVFTMDANNFLTRIDREDGTRIWRVPVSYPLAEIQGVTYLPNYRRVLVLSGGELFVLNDSDGSQTEKQTLRKIANTEAVPYGDRIIYGSRNGQLIWHSHTLGVEQRGYQIATSIQVKPLLRNNLVVVIGIDGEVMVLDASSATKYWRKKLLDAIVAPPAVSPSAVYIAGTDRHVWAFEIGTGRQAWKYLTASPLTEGPVLVGDQLYQQVPDDGLICFEALPYGEPGGVITWTNPDISGSVITKRRENLVCWDRQGRKIEVVTSVRGGHVTTVELPDVERLIATDTIEGEIYAASAKGKVIRLVPRN